jgi:hypothetical protein
MTLSSNNPNIILDKAPVTLSAPLPFLEVSDTLDNKTSASVEDTRGREVSYELQKTYTGPLNVSCVDYLSGFKLIVLLFDDFLYYRRPSTLPTAT